MQERATIIKRIMWDNKHMYGRNKGFLFVIPNCAGVSGTAKLEELIYSGKTLGAPDLSWRIDDLTFYFRIATDKLKARQLAYDEKIRKNGDTVYLLTSLEDWARLKEVIAKKVKKNRADKEPKSTFGQPYLGD